MKKQKMSSPNDVTQLVKLCQQGEKEGFSQLVDSYSSRLYGYFYRLTGNRDDSNELLSELFLKIVEKIGTCRPETFNAWLFKMASNLFMDYIRAKKRHEKMLDQMAKEVQTEIQPLPAGDHMTDKLTRQLQRLDAETAEIIVMRYYSGLSFEELAKIRKEPLGTCLSKVHRGLKRLRQLMENSDD
ncbi:MAG: RNA polymerase sigma factor [Phycisphaerae bacterium]|nr:RNA polymerase sigma factor [Phycisphaerae bacterium]